MMLQTMLSTKVGGSGTRWVLSWMVLVVLSLTTAARGGGGPNGSSPPDSSPTASSPGDEVTSLPLVDAQTGLTFVGSAHAIRRLELEIAGRGRISIARLGGGDVAVTFAGDYRIELDRAALALGEVTVLFRGGRAFQGGLARLAIGDAAPVYLDPERVPLPLGRIAQSPRLRGELVSLDVLSRSHQARVEAHFGSSRATLFQRLD
jgi:hypothetical protein